VRYDQIEEKEMSPDEAKKLLDEKTMKLYESMKNPGPAAGPAFDSGEAYRLTEALYKLREQIDELNPGMDNVRAAMGLLERYRRDDDQDNYRRGQQHERESRDRWEQEQEERAYREMDDRNSKSNRRYEGGQQIEGFY
jgi:hypothetical protein